MEQDLINNINSESTKRSKNSYKALAVHINRTVDLPTLMEELSQKPFRWNREGESAVCNCPMVNHNDRNASFHMNKLDGSWAFQCFGCGSKGNTVQFFMDFTGEPDFKKAIIELCKYLKIECDGDLPVDTFTRTTNRVNLKKEIEIANIVASNICRRLLKTNFDLHKDWVFDAYKQLNEATDNFNSEEIERIGSEAHARFNRK